MPRRLRSVRVRLILRSVMLVAGLVIVASGVALVVMERRLESDLDDSLGACAADGLRRVDTRWFAGVRGPELRQGLLLELSEAHRPHGLDDLTLALREPKDDFASRGSSGPEDVATTLASFAPHIETDAEGRRGITLRSPASGVELRLTASRRSIRQQLAGGRRIALVGLLVSLVATALAAFLVTGSMVQRIDRISARLGELTPDRLDMRLAPPDVEDEVGRLVRVLNAMLDRLERGFEAQERFIHDASHELKTPIAVLLSEAAVLQRGELDTDEARRFVASVREEMGSLGELVEGLLMLTPSHRNEALSRATRVSVNDAVMRAVGLCDLAARRSGVTLRLTLALPEDREALEVFGDEALLASCVSNLLRNALKFSPRESVVAVTVEQRGDEVELSVADEGPGIPEEALARLFERWYQAPGEGPRRGTGLGLDIARSIATFHRGSIRAENRAERGCRFTVTLPLAGSAGR